jgi:hypothetical protein
MKCDVIASGIVAAAKQVGVKVPLVSADGRWLSQRHGSTPTPTPGWHPIKPGEGCDQCAMHNANSCVLATLPSIAPYYVGN